MLTFLTCPSLALLLPASSLIPIPVGLWMGRGVDLQGDPGPEGGASSSFRALGETPGFRGLLDCGFLRTGRRRKVKPGGGGWGRCSQSSSRATLAVCPGSHCHRSACEPAAGQRAKESGRGLQAGEDGGCVWKPGRQLGALESGVRPHGVRWPTGPPLGRNPALGWVSCSLQVGEGRVCVYRCAKETQTETRETETETGVNSNTRDFLSSPVHAPNAGGPRFNPWSEN